MIIFFKLGGHSLSTIKLKNRINKELSVTIDLKDVFTYSTVRFLLDHISNLEETLHDFQFLKYQNKLIILCPRHRNACISFMNLIKKGTSYNMPSFYRIEGKLDVPRFEASFQRIGGTSSKVSGHYSNS